MGNGAVWVVVYLCTESEEGIVVTWSLFALVLR